MGRRSSLILPRKFRRGFRGVTGGGGAAGWTTLGPNAPSGLTTPYPDFLGDTLPYKQNVYASTMISNLYGWSGTWGDTRAYTIEADAESPSGYAMRLNFYGYNSPRNGIAWGTTGGMGGSPCKAYMFWNLFDPAAGRRWKRLYIHMWQRFSPNFSLQCHHCTRITHYTGTINTGSTVSHIIDLTKSWTPGELVGKFGQFGTGHGNLILANDATSFDIEDRFDYGPAGNAYTVFTWDPNPGTLMDSVGAKGWFWPRQAGRLVGPVAGRGDGAILGPWNAPKDFEGRLGDNHYHGCWDGPSGAPGAPGEFMGTQQAKFWDPPYTEDANDLPVWNLAGRNQYFPGRLPVVPYVAGQLRKMEYLMILPTPGVADGIWRAYQDGVLVKESTAGFFTEKYYSADSVRAVSGEPRPIIGGADRDAAYECLDNFFMFIDQNMVGGGAPSTQLLPENDMWTQILACAVSGSNSRG
jgi:hypothetical protein